MEQQILSNTKCCWKTKVVILHQAHTISPQVLYALGWFICNIYNIAQDCKAEFFNV